MRDIHFAGPEYAPLLLIAIAIAILLYFLSRHQKKVLSLFSEKSFDPPTNQCLRGVLYTLAWIFAVLSLMGPQGGGTYIEGDEQDIISEELRGDVAEGSTLASNRRRIAHDVIFLIDVSASMAVTDTRTKDTRLQAAKDLIEEMASRLDGQSAALYAFTSELTTVVPPTPDYLYLRLMLKQVSINEGDVAGTDLLEALETVRKKHFRNAQKKNKTLILLTDGGDTRLESLNNQDRKREIRTILSRLGNTEDVRLRVFCLGLGSKQGEIVPGVRFEGQAVRSSLDEELLVELAEKGRGRYYLVNDYSTLAIVDDIFTMIQKDSPWVDEEGSKEPLQKAERLVESDNNVQFTLYFQYPLFFALLCLGLALTLPKCKWQILPYLVLAHSLLGDFQSDAAYAQSLFQGGQYVMAAEEFKKLLDEDISPETTESVTYNFATALLESGDLDTAARYLLEVADSPESSSFLQMRAYHNLALIRYLASENEELSSAITTLEDSLSMIKKAMEKEREHAISEGKSWDAPSKSLKDLETASRLRLIWAIAENKKRKLESMENKELAQLLIQHTAKSKAVVQEIAKLDEDQRQVKLKSHAILEKNQTDIWKRLRDKVPEDEFTQDLFTRGEKHYFSSLDYMQEGASWKAHGQMGQSTIFLKVLAHLLNETDSLEAVLKHKESLEKRLDNIHLRPLKLNSEKELDTLNFLASSLALGLAKALEKEDKAVEAAWMRALSHGPTLEFYRDIKKSEEQNFQELLKNAHPSKKAHLIKKMEIRQKVEPQEKVPEVLALLRADKILDAAFTWNEDFAVAFLMKELEESYQQTLRNLNDITWTRLEEEETRLKEFLDKTNNPPMKSFESMVQRRQNARNRWEAGYILRAELFLNAAMHTARRMREEFTRSGEENAHEILKGSIFEQSVAIEKVFLAKKIARAEGLTSAIIDIIAASQEYALNRILEFKNFPLDHPNWDKALSLVKKGIVKSKEAIGSFSGKPLELDTPLQLQTEALRLLREALDKLNDPENNQKGDGGQDGRDPPPQDQDNSDGEDSPPANENRDMSLQRSLELLQELEREDQSHIPKKNVRPKEGSRPW